MKALTIRQPWASQIISGEKTIEWRSWPTKFRGPLAIHAAKIGAGPGPRGCMLGTVEVIDCQRVENPPFPNWPYAWALANPQPFAEPIPASGNTSLWEWDPNAAQIENDLFI